MSKGKKVVDDRRKTSSEELAKVKSGEALGGGLLYVERVRSSKGPGSKWAKSILDETGGRHQCRR